MQAKMGQRLVMTPAMQQAIKLLPLTKLELIASIRTELDENPFLEEGDSVEEEEEKDLSEETPKEDSGFEEETGVVKEEPKKEEPDGPDWEAFLQEEAYSGGTGEGYAEKPSIENTLRNSETIYDHLLWQLNVTVLDPKKNAIGQEILGDMDEEGFFKMELLDVAEKADCTVEDVAEVLDIIKNQFDPTGVCASDVTESLLLQAMAIEPDDPVIKEIILGFLPELSERNFAKIAKTLGVDTQRVIEVVEFIRSLDPKPGASFSQQKPDYVEPDIYVVRVDDEWQVFLNDDGVPKLKINNYYRKVLKASKNSNFNNEKEKEFIESKVQSAIWLVKSIEQRRQTMLKVGRSLVKFQDGFLKHGISHLKPLVLKNVAEDIEMHESTISRVTRNKYIHTPQGIFELKYFFHSGVSSYLGNTVSSVRVKEMIKKIVMEEDAKKPATDDKIVALLQTRDVKIARRTVTKYRKELRIPSGSKRKRIY